MTSQDKEVLLMRRFESGEEDRTKILAELMELYFDFTVSFAHYVSRFYPESVDDLQSELLYALVITARSYDPSKGALFKSYLVAALKHRTVAFFRTYHREVPAGLCFADDTPDPNDMVSCCEEISVNEKAREILRKVGLDNNIAVDAFLKRSTITHAARVLKMHRSTLSRRFAKANKSTVVMMLKAEIGEGLVCQRL